ncbi:hypothetical protein [Cardinium endosymbiont of Nabis limbatus]|uniref:hypothetical protein n=1 Tax=Cardinium endosymbiont of Nabis limbatus TaxID=3066217 RepID=UPI003AF36466
MQAHTLPKFLFAILATLFLTGFKVPLPAKTAPTSSHKGIWSIPIGIGTHWKPKAETAANHNGWIGCVATIGIRWEKLFCKRYTFSAGLLWGLFLPDMFMADKPTDFHIDFFKIHIKIPYNLALFLPMTSLQLGYWANSQWHLSCGLIYFYALELNVKYLISPKISLNGACCFFLDKIFKNHGIHLGFATIGIDYRLFR